MESVHCIDLHFNKQFVHFKPLTFYYGVSEVIIDNYIFVLFYVFVFVIVPLNLVISKLTKHIFLFEHLFNLYYKSMCVSRHNRMCVQYMLELVIALQNAVNKRNRQPVI